MTLSIRLFAALCVALAESFSSEALGQACRVGGNGIDQEIKLFSYAGDSSGFHMFDNIVQAKIHQMSYVVQGKNLPDISALSLLPPQDDTLVSLHDEIIYSTNHPEYLSIWRGRIEPLGQPTRAVSDIYLGRFKGDLQKPEVTVELPLVAQDSVNKTLDSHSMVIFYALAVDAQSARCSPDVVKGFLNQALLSYRDIQRQHAINDDVELVGQAIISLGNRIAPRRTP